jgi:feruloyl esterase
MMNGIKVFAIVLVASFVPMLRAQSCEGLAKLSFPTVSITLAKTVETGDFVPADGTRKISALPAFCRVAVELKPTSDSDIRTEIWLPVVGWNGKFLAVGSGGWGGSIAYEGWPMRFVVAMLPVLRMMVIQVGVRVLW